MRRLVRCGEQKYPWFLGATQFLGEFAAGRTVTVLAVRRRMPHRCFTPDLSYHLIHRGNNRMAIFQCAADHAVYLSILRDACDRDGVLLHAYVEMTTHCHLMVTPNHEVAVPRMMQRLGLKYVRYYNRKYNRTGTLWNGRYRALPIDTDKYWVTCLRYVEQNPVRAGMAETPAGYLWSSYTAHAFGRWPNWLTPHRVYLAMGPTPEQRQRAYRSLCDVAVDDDQVTLIRSFIRAPVAII